MPKPRPRETESDFVERCIPIVLDEGTAEDGKQAAAICHSLWSESRKRSYMKTDHEKLVAAIKARGNKQTAFNGGILLADAYARTLLDCVGHEACNKYACTRHKSFDDALKRAGRTLTYNNPDMQVAAKARDVYTDIIGDLKNVELPKNTLMVFKHTLTTPRKDRDGDILRTQGAKPDPKMLLLWQHVHTLPIGKMLAVAEHSTKKLVLVSAIVDLNELAHDAAVMVDNGMGRFSHGFRALEYVDLKEEGGSTTSPGGFDVKLFEIMEESLVSVPSNVDAEVQEVLVGLVESGKLTSPLMKQYGGALRAKMPAQVQGGITPINVNINLNGKSINANQPADKPAAGKGKQGCTCASEEAHDDGDKAAEGGADDKEMMCPECGKGKMVDGVCEKCGYKASDDKAAYDQDNADANNDMGSVLCPKCGTVALVDGKCPSCGYTPTGKAAKPGIKSVYPGMIAGSWEYTEMKLREGARGYLQRHGINVDDGDKGYSWVGLVATFPDAAIINVERNYGDQPQTYYRVGWEQDSEGEPVFTGTPSEVKIQVAAKIMEKLAEHNGAKAGRVLSTKNLKALVGVRGDVQTVHDTELIMSKGGKALCKQAAGTLQTIIDEAGGEGESAALPTVKAAMAAIIAQADAAERKHLKASLDALDFVEQRAAETEEILALVGG